MSLAAFVINLDQATERLIHFEAQARAAGIVFERLSAVDGRLMSPSECAEWHDPAAIYPLSRPEIGCIRSHQKAWQKIIESGSDWGAVFEDDVCLSTELGAILGQTAQIPAEIDLIKLEAIADRRVLLGGTHSHLAGRTLRHLRGIALGSAGYLISNNACQRLLRATRLPSIPIDMYLFSRWHGAYRNLNVFVLLPLPVIQAHTLQTAPADMVFSSQISDRGKAMLPRLSLSKRLKREWFRIKAQVSGIGAEPVILEWR